jgi:hypothetical protein
MAEARRALYLPCPWIRKASWRRVAALPCPSGATLTKADRLRYAGALMRAGRADAASAIYDQISHEAGSVEHGGGGAARGPDICASSLLAAGFPEPAVPYARQARRLRANDPTLALLLVRALAASGAASEARSSLRAVARDADGWVIALADMPSIKSTTIAALVRELRSGGTLVAPEPRRRRADVSRLDPRQRAVPSGEWKARRTCWRRASARCRAA